MVRPASETPRAAQPDDTPAVSVLVLAALPLVLWGVSDDPVTQGGAALAGCLLIAAFRLISRGQRLARAYAATLRARAPRVPRKILGAALIGVAAFLMADFRIGPAWHGAVIGAVCFVLTLLVFGVDPLRDKTDKRPKSSGLLSEVEAALVEAEARIAAIGDAELMHEMTAFADHVTALLHRVSRRDRGRVEGCRALLETVCADIHDEIARLERGDCGPFACRRFVDRLDAVHAQIEADIGALSDGGDPADWRSGLAAPAADAPEPASRAA